MQDERNSLFQTVAFRYAMLYVSVISVLTFSILSLFYGFVYYKKLQPTFSLINSEYRQVEQVYNLQGIEGLKKHLLDYATERESDAFYILVDKNKNKLMGNMPAWPMHFSSWGHFHSINLDGAEGLINLSARVFERDGFRLVLAYSIDSLFSDIKLLGLSLSQFMLGVIVIGFIGALVVSYDSMRRVNAVNDSIQTIMSGDLSERVKTRRSDGEFHALASNANKMLDRIQELVVGMRQFSNNIAHDLRTPLTRLRNNLETLSDDASPQNIKVVESLITEADGLLATFNAVLRIAQIESATTRENFKNLDLATILHDVIELYEPLAHDKNIIVSAENIKNSYMQGDKDMLFQVFANLLDNAIKYSPENTCIVIRCVYRLGIVKVSIADQGMGVPANEITKVFDRFYRVEASRSLKPGNGLGLSLVSAVVDLHKGMISLIDNDPGLRVEVKFEGLKNAKKIQLNS